MLPESVQRCSVGRQRRRDLQVAIFEDERGERAEEDVAGGAAGNRKRGRGCCMEGELEVGVFHGDDMGLELIVAALEHWWRGLPRDDALRNLPSSVMGVGDSDS